MEQQTAATNEMGRNVSEAAQGSAELARIAAGLQQLVQRFGY